MTAVQQRGAEEQRPRHVTAGARLIPGGSRQGARRGWAAVSAGWMLRSLSIFVPGRAAWSRAGRSSGRGRPGCGASGALSLGSGGLRHLWRAVMGRDGGRVRSVARRAGHWRPSRVLIAARAGRRPTT